MCMSIKTSCGTFEKKIYMYIYNFYFKEKKKPGRTKRKHDTRSLPLRYLLYNQSEGKNLLMVKDTRTMELTKL